MSQDNFIEKQYLGLNRSSLTSRLSFDCFLFFCLLLERNHNKEGELFFFIGITIIIFSVILFFFVLHFETRVSNGSIILDGLWTSRKIKIDTISVASARKVNYSKYKINLPVYNLHFKGKIRFYTRGYDAVELIDKDGLMYLIGSQRAEELSITINNTLR